MLTRIWRKEIESIVVRSLVQENEQRIKVFYNSFNEKAIESGRISTKPRIQQKHLLSFLDEVTCASCFSLGKVYNKLPWPPSLSWPLTRLHYGEQKFPSAQSSRENKWKIAFHQIVFNHHLEPPCSSFAELAWWSLIECWAEMDQISRLQIIILALLSNSTPSECDCKCHVQTKLKDPPFTFKFQCFWHLHCKTMKWIFFENFCKRHVISSLSPAATFQNNGREIETLFYSIFSKFSCLPCVSANRE